MQQVAHILYSTRKAPYKEGAGLQGSCTLWSECATLFMGVSRILSLRGICPFVESVLSWTLIIVPSFWTVVQIQTGDNFQRCQRGPENEGFLHSSSYKAKRVEGLRYHRFVQHDFYAFDGKRMSKYEVGHHNRRRVSGHVSLLSHLVHCGTQLRVQQ